MSSFRRDLFSKLPKVLIAGDLSVFGPGRSYLAVKIRRMNGSYLPQSYLPVVVIFAFKDGRLLSRSYLDDDGIIEYNTESVNVLQIRDLIKKQSVSFNQYVDYGPMVRLDTSVSERRRLRVWRYLSQCKPRCIAKPNVGDDDC